MSITGITTGAIVVQSATNRCPLRRPSRSPVAVPSPVDVEVSYLLVHTGQDPAVSPELGQRHAGLGLCGPGWTVLAAHGSRWSWSIRLDAHGAGYGAPARVAQAVAVRVLSDHDIEVQGWDPADPEIRAYVAVTTAGPIPHPRRGPSRWPGGAGWSRRRQGRR